jgi:general secretion pathway protein A
MTGTPAPEEPGLLIYEPFYGLAEKPFSLATDPRFLYQSASHMPVFRDVLAGIRRREGLVVLTGEIGMGKTTLCRSVLAALDRKTFAAFVPDPFVTREDLLKILLVEFGIVSLDDFVRGRLRGAPRGELSYALYEFLRSLEPLDAFAVLLIDEAQNLPADLLEEVRILADLEGVRRLLQVVLIGQPELSAVLQQPHMRQVTQRVTTHCELQSLDCEGVHGYVRHRLLVAGAAADRRYFAPAALDLVFGATGGVPRVINRLCDAALLRGHAVQAAVIGPDLMREAIAELQLTLPTSPEPVAEVRSTETPRVHVEPTRLYRPAPRPRGARSVVATAALVVLGGLSGLTLAIYWLWAGPVMTARVGVPAVKRPPMRIAAPLPAVLDPDIEAIGDPLDLPEPADAAGQADPSTGVPRPVTAAPPASAQSLWVVQVEAFADASRAASLVRDLSARGFTAFQSAGIRRSGAPLHVVLVGPFAVRTQAAAALDRIEDIPGMGRPTLQVVPPAAALR